MLKTKAKAEKAGGAAIRNGEIAAPPQEEKKKRRHKKWTSTKKIVVFLVIGFLLLASGHFVGVYMKKVLSEADYAIVNRTEAIRADDLMIAGIQPNETLKLAYQLSTVAYEPTGDEDWISLLEENGFANIQRIENSARFLYDYEKSYKKDKVRFAFSSVNAIVATKSINLGGTEKTLITVAFKGTNPANVIDDLSDMVILQNGDGIHKGFSWNAENFFAKKDSIVLSVNGEEVSLGEAFESMKSDNSPYVMLVTGHSLGAAVADVLVGYILYKDGVLPANTLAVTFAAPRSADLEYEYNYDNIYNIINSDDIVPVIGAQRHIGKNLVFSPDDDFRSANYKKHSVIAKVYGYNTLAGTLTSAFAPHDIHTSYKGVYEEIINNGDVYFQ